MIVPTNVVSALLIVVLVVPGFVFTSIRGTLRGPRGIQDTDLSSRLAGAIVVSIIFDAVYLMISGVLIRPDHMRDLASLPVKTLSEAPFPLGAIVLGCGVVLPAAVAVLAYYRVEWHPRAIRLWPSSRRTTVHLPARRGGYRNFPTAWDRSAPGLGGSFVRIRMPDGKWAGGWFSSESFVGTYPHSRDIYIEKQYVMRKDGRFGDAIESSNGVWLSVGEEHIVEWVTSPSRPETQGDQHGNLG